MYDLLRKKEVPDTPEEGVRQQIIRWLNEQVGVPLSLMASEYSFKFNKLNYRADIVVFDRSAKPLMLVECKAPSIKLDREVMEQGMRYNRVLNVRYMMFTNGNSSYICKLDTESREYHFLSEVPSYEQMCNS